MMWKTIIFGFPLITNSADRILSLSPSVCLSVRPFVCPSVRSVWPGGPLQTPSIFHSSTTAEDENNEQRRRLVDQNSPYGNSSHLTHLAISHRITEEVKRPLYIEQRRFVESRKVLAFLPSCSGQMIFGWMERHMYVCMYVLLHISSTDEPRVKAIHPACCFCSAHTYYTHTHLLTQRIRNRAAVLGAKQRRYTVLWSMGWHGHVHVG